MRITGDTIQPTLGSNITVPDAMGINVGNTRVGQIGAGYGAFTGNVVQCRVTRYDTRTSIATGTSINGIEITGLRVSITPKFASSMILCMFQVFGEGASTYNYLMNVYKNGSVPSGTYASFNSEAGNQTWSGLAMSIPYETDFSTTPYQVTYYYHDFPNSINVLTYAPGIINTEGNNTTYYINRPVNSTGLSGQEVGVSFSIAWEIAQ